MKNVIEKAIKALSGKAEGAGDSANALRFSQAACNLANALSSFNGDKRQEEVQDSKKEIHRARSQ